MAATDAIHRDQHPVHEELGGYEGSKLAMWLFLATELLLFGVLFALFALFHGKYVEEFKLAHHTLDKTMGTLNTVVLIVSSLSVALSLDSIQRGRRKLCVWLLAATIALAGVFLVVKYFEYKSKFEHEIFPGAAAEIHAPEAYLEAVHAGEHTPPESVRKDIEKYGHKTYISLDEYATYKGFDEAQTLRLKEGVDVFFSFYFLMTGVHGLHVVIGMTVIAFLMVFALAGRYSHWNYTPIENGALYWHLVDLIWIYLFPLFYLIA